MTERKGDIVTGKTHYVEHPSGVECWDIVEVLSFNLGCAVKYVWRRNLKGNPREDLAKALNYVNRERDRLKPPPDYPEEIWFDRMSKVIRAETDENARRVFALTQVSVDCHDHDDLDTVLGDIAEAIQRMLDDLA